MSHEAFLRAVRDRPDDDLPRLVYADWLEEHGDAARAEFIRVQCDLARTPADDPRHAGLEDREHDLLGEHEPTWLQLGADEGYVSEWQFERGFLADLTSYINIPTGNLWASNPLTRWRVIEEEETRWRDFPLLLRGKAEQTVQLDCSHWQTVLWGFSELLASHLWSGLRLLDLSGTPGINRLGDLLSVTHARQQLTSLAFGRQSRSEWANTDAETLDVSAFNEALARTRLESLAAFDCGLTADGLRAMLSSPWAESLTALDVSDNPIGPDGWRAFAHAPRGLRLDKLDASGTALAGIGLEPVLNARPCETLTRLEIDRCGSARTNMEVLAASPFWANATELRMHSGTIPADALDPLTNSSGPPRLRLLDLSANFLRTDGVSMLAFAPWAESLTWLGLSQNYLDDNALRVLAGCGRFRKLRTLHLARNNRDQFRSDGEEITDAGVAALAASAGLANLRVLTLNYTAVTDRSVGVVLNAPHWRLSGLGLAGVGLTEDAARELADSPRLARLNWLDLSGNPGLSGDALLPLAESPYLSRLCELDIRGMYAGERVRQALRARLGPRLSE